ncbi:MAG: biotin/lipoate A/B protein ligase family protein [Acidobacteriota bacterium]
MAAKTWKLLIEPEPLPGDWNMAVDEFLFRRVEASPATYLRFYQWDKPTASLGYLQTASRVVDADYCRRRGVGIVRRITGGKLVLHDREVTYAVASSDAEVFTETLRDSYRLISQALMRGLELMGLSARMAETSPPAYVKGVMPCFALPARDEIEIGGKKIVGSAQKRTGAAFLQHGSIPIEKDEDLLAAVAAPGARAAASGMRPAVSGMTSLSEALGRPADFGWAVDHFRRGFADIFGVALEPFVLGPGDREAVAALRDERYATDAWTFRS